ncbi:MAG: glycosyltransferase family A protein [Pseudomonadota bacterium]
MTGPPNTAAIAIGRNEGARLTACLASLKDKVDRIVYVDSGSTDGSQEAARAMGATVLELDLSTPFTAARARNAGLEALGAATPETSPEFVQFIDGDCVLRDDWISKAQSFLAAHPDVAVVCGRRRERHPEASVYNRLADDEWDTPVGAAKSCGGDAMMRLQAVVDVNGYNPGLIAGEEPELCVRLRAAGWKIWRIDAEMTLHDAALTRFGQWWQRARRGGFAYAQGAALHGAPPERHCVRELRHILVWGLILPVVILAGLFVSPWSLALALLWPAQILRRLMRGDTPRAAVFITLAKFPEAAGVLTYVWRRLSGAEDRLIEYK